MSKIGLLGLAVQHASNIPHVKAGAEVHINNRVAPLKAMTAHHVGFCQFEF